MTTTCRFCGRVTEVEITEVGFGTFTMQPDTCECGILFNIPGQIYSSNDALVLNISQEKQ